MSANWPVDELVQVYLGGGRQSSSPSIPLKSGWKSGARAEPSRSAAEPGRFAFRRAIAEGRSIGAAAEGAMRLDRAFDVGNALGTMFAENLVVAVGVGR